MSGSEKSEDQEEQMISDATGVMLMVVATVVLTMVISFVVFPALGVDIAPSQVSTSGAVVEDTSEENVYYVQPQTGGTASGLQMTFRTTQSVFVDLEQSENIQIATRENSGIKSNEIYTNPNFDPEDPPSANTVYDPDTPPHMQLVKVEVVDPSQDAKIFLSAKGGEEPTESVPVMSWTIPSGDSSGQVSASFDVENNRLEVYPSGYFD